MIGEYMEKYQEKIEEVLTQALTEKTFSLEIIEKIKSLKDGFQANELLLEELHKRLEFVTKENVELKDNLSKTTDKLNKYIEREETIKTKESNQKKTEYELEFQKARANEIKELMMIVFKNPVVRSSTFNNTYDSGSSKSYSGGITTENE